MRSYRALFVMLALCVLSGCAKIGTPVGGPLDKTAPHIVSHYPLADALQVEPDDVVEIVFSEMMDRERTEEALFVSPTGPQRLKWNGTKLRVEMPLATDRTYVLTVGTGARDLRGNSLEQSFTLAFATGAKLDQGLVHGRVYNAHQPAPRAHVWAYDLGVFAGQIGFDEPSYKIQSDADGAYEFTRLAQGRYRVLAFIDGNRNALPDEEEWLALPAADVEVGEAVVLAGDLALARLVAETPELKRVQAVHEKRLLFLFSEAVDPAVIEVEIEGLAVEAVYAAVEAAEKIYIETQTQEPGRTYAVRRLVVEGVPIPWHEPIRGNARPDTKPPSVIVPIGAQKASGDTLDLLFSEAMRPVALRDFWQMSDSTQAPAGVWQWSAPNRARFVAEQPLAPGAYRLIGQVGLLADWAGHGLADSSLTLSITVGPATAVIRGQVQAELTGPVRVEAVGEGGRTYGAWADSAGDFALDGLLAGRYILWAFVDRDGDGVLDSGSLDPFVLSEPYGRYGESMDLASGQQVEEVLIRCR
jgi:uncharacterized protein (DUF2141 family)